MTSQLELEVMLVYKKYWYRIKNLDVKLGASSEQRTIGSVGYAKSKWAPSSIKLSWNLFQAQKYIAIVIMYNFTVKVYQSVTNSLRSRMPAPQAVSNKPGLICKSCVNIRAMTARVVFFTRNSVYLFILFLS